MYQLVNTSSGQSMVLRLIDRTWIPFDPSNSDYQAYLKWVEAGNTPLPADEQGTSNV
jgi:hypothetical protein